MLPSRHDDGHASKSPGANSTTRPATTISGTVYGCSQESTSLSNSQVVYGCDGAQTPLPFVCVEASTSDVPNNLGDAFVQTESDGSYTLSVAAPMSFPISFAAG